MEEDSPVDVDMSGPLAVVCYQRRKLNTRRKKQAAAEEAAAEGFSTFSDWGNHNDGEFSQRAAAPEASHGENHNANASEFEYPFKNQEFPQGITVSEFDYSVENHFKAVDTISELCGETGEFDPDEVQRLSSSIKFLREWRQFSYPPRTLRFLSQNESNGKDFAGSVTLPQFSSAAVPKKSAGKDEVPSELRNDFVMHVGGLVSALDWCPRVQSHSNSGFQSEFIAVAAHPPESSYHIIGEPVAGRGMIQIWCVLSSNIKKSLASRNPKKRKRPLGRPRKNPVDACENSVEQRPKGRPRKQPADVNKDPGEKRPKGRPRKLPADVNKDPGEKRPKGRPRKLPADVNNNKAGKQPSKQPADVSSNPHEQQLTVVSNNPAQKRPRGRPPRKKPADVNNNPSEQQLSKQPADVSSNPAEQQPSKPPVDVNDSPAQKQPSGRPAKLPDDVNPTNKKSQLSENCGIVKEVSRIQDTGNATVDENTTLPSQNTIGFDSILVKCSSSIHNDVALPRLVFSLAHNGKVVWDLKWCPSNGCDQQRMGNLACLLGNGALEVWEVPFPRIVNSIYSDSQEHSTDPRFIKLQPVFRCSAIKCGDRQSIPLCLEWSSSFPHDKILAGCHDGVVALWKFCATNSLEDSRPLLCISADTVPIRTLSWAPVESTSEGSNIVVTGSFKGLKFWDLRDPFSPLWVLNPYQQMVYSLDWLPNPRCIIVAFEDGTLRILSLLNGASDIPVTGEPFVGSHLKGKGYHSYYCSQFSIWSVHVSRLTGMVAYCGVDGTALYFQLTTKAVEKNPHRNREPHFLCGMLTEEGSTLTMLTPLPDVPFPTKMTDSVSQTPRSKRGFMYNSTQEKRAKEGLKNIQRSDEQPLALCYDIDSEGEFGSAGASTSKRKANSKKAAKEDQQPLLLLCGNDHQDKDLGGGEQGPLSAGMVGDEADKKFESLPPKMVALHKVRWNVNVGSENWLCYGGAAGVLRCQEMDTIM